MKLLTNLLTISFLIITCYEKTKGQTNEVTYKANNIYAELLGTGGLYSLNYERIIIAHQKAKFGIRIGGSAWGTQRPYLNSIAELVGITGQGNHHVDIGLGFNKGYGPDVNFDEYKRINHFYFVPRLSYRYQKWRGGDMFRIGINPFIPLNKETPNRFSAYPLYFGIAFGHTF
ncbi:hypothetical protein [Spirosoma litoris]